MSTRAAPGYVRLGSVLARLLVLLADGKARTADEVAEAISGPLLAVRSELSRAASWGWLQASGDNGNEGTGPTRGYLLTVLGSKALYQDQMLRTDEAGQIIGVATIDRCLYCRAMPTQPHQDRCAAITMGGTGHVKG